MVLVGEPWELSPNVAQDAAGFVELLQRLKEHSGLTYRELEERAARNGDVLARSTLADALRRKSLPRANVVAAFVRACGDGQRTDAWLEARARIAEESEAAVREADAAAVPATDAAASVAGAVSDVAVALGSETEAAARPAAQAWSEAKAWPEAQARPETQARSAAQPWPEVQARSEVPVAPPFRRARNRVVTLATVLMVPLLALAIWGLLPDSSGDAGVRPSPAATVAAPPAGGWVTIHPAGAPGLCLTEGRDRGGAYASAVAVQLPCARAAIPRTYLEPVSQGLYRIQWHHPQMGKGCLTIMGSGPVKGMLEPRNDCAKATQFHLESPATASPPATAGTPAADRSHGGGFLLRPAHGSRCVGAADSATAAEGAEVVEEPCTGAADQTFLFRTG